MPVGDELDVADLAGLGSLCRLRPAHPQHACDPASRTLTIPLAHEDCRLVVAQECNDRGRIEVAEPHQRAGSSLSRASTTASNTSSVDVWRGAYSRTGSR